MKTRYGMMTGLTVLALAFSAEPARAINKEWSAVLGFLGGVVVANAANASSSVYVERPIYVQQPVYVEQPVYVQQPVYVEQPVAYCPPPPPPVVYVEPSGYYEWRTQRVWVPGVWIMSTDPWGYARRSWQPGYYRSHRIQVWVPHPGRTYSGHGGYGGRPYRPSRHHARWR